nr:taste receptor type 1 member 2-like [Peromyscus maniculatus bairdii]
MALFKATVDHYEIIESLFTLGEMDHQRCFDYWKPSTYMKADIILGAFVPIYITIEGFYKSHIFFEIKPDILDNFPERWKNHQYLLAFYFAIEEINKDVHLLPNVTLGFHLYNAFNSHRRILEGPLMWLSGRSEFIPNYKCKTQHKALGIIAGTRPEFSAAIGTLLDLYKVPQVTYGTFDSMLSDRDTFPSLYQMSPKDTALTKGVTSLLLHFGWKWIGLIVSDDLKGKEFLSDLKAEMVSEDICVAFTEKLQSNWKFQIISDVGLVNLIKHTQANVHVFYGDIDALVFFCMQNEIMKSIRKVWIMAKSHLVYLESVFYENNYLKDFFEGSFSFSKKRDIPGFKPFLEALTPSQYPGELYFNKFWIDNFYCSPPPLLCGNHKPCPLNTSLKRKQEINVMTTSEPSVSIWNAVYAVAHTLHKMLLRTTGMGSHEDTNHDRLLPWQTPQSVCTQSCGPGFWKILEDERPICCFSCMLCPESYISNQTGRELIFSSIYQQECIPCPLQEYPNPERNKCFLKSVTFLSFEDSLGKALACTALCFSVSTAVVLGIFLKHQDSPIVKANNRTLSFILLISLLLCFLCSFLFIGHPSTASCILQQIAFALVFTLALSTVLAKTITVILAFRALKPGRTMRRLLVSGIHNSVIPICVLIQLILLGVWLGTSPPYIEADAHSEQSHIIILCNKGSLTAFYCVLGYLGILALGSFTLAFLARNLPDTFNEAKFLTFSMLVFCSVWVTFLPVYHSTKDKAMVAVEVFSILTSSAGLLGCIFFPKCYIILVKPDENSLKYLKNKIQSR